MVKAKKGLEIDGGGGPFLAPADTKISVLLSASVERFGVPVCGIFYCSGWVSHSITVYCQTVCVCRQQG